MDTYIITVGLAYYLWELVTGFSMFGEMFGGKTVRQLTGITLQASSTPEKQYAHSKDFESLDNPMGYMGVVKDSITKEVNGEQVTYVTVMRQPVGNPPVAVEYSTTSLTVLNKE